jgi:hypothetical protein
MYLQPNFPTRVWDGATGNPERAEGAVSDCAPNAADWDRIALEVIATQSKVAAMGAASVPDPTGLANGDYVLRVTDGVASWVAHS